MATLKPRITITLQPQTHAILASMSGFSGQSMSSIISGLLESAAPTMERMAVAFQSIRRMQDAEQQTILKQLDDAQSVLEPLVMQAANQYDLFVAQVAAAGSGAAGDTAQRGRRATLRQPSASPSTNRGVTPSLSKSPKPSSRKAFEAKSKISKLQKKSAQKEGANL